MYVVPTIQFLNFLYLPIQTHAWLFLVSGTVPRIPDRTKVEQGKPTLFMYVTYCMYSTKAQVAGAQVRLRSPPYMQSHSFSLTWLRRFLSLIQWL